MNLHQHEVEPSLDSSLSPVVATNRQPRPTELTADERNIIRRDFNLPNFDRQESGTGCLPWQGWFAVALHTWSINDASRVIVSPHDYLAVRDNPVKLEQFISYLARAGIVQTYESDGRGSDHYEYLSDYLVWMRSCCKNTEFCDIFDHSIARLTLRELAQAHIPSKSELAALEMRPGNVHPLWDDIHMRTTTDDHNPRTAWFAPLHTLLTVAIALCKENPQSPVVPELFAEVKQKIADLSPVLFVRPWHPPDDFRYQMHEAFPCDRDIGKLLLELMEVSQPQDGSTHALWKEILNLPRGQIEPSWYPLLVSNVFATAPQDQDRKTLFAEVLRVCCAAAIASEDSDTTFPRHAVAQVLTSEQMALLLPQLPRSSDAVFTYSRFFFHRNYSFLGAISDPQIQVTDRGYAINVALLSDREALVSQEAVDVLSPRSPDTSAAAEFARRTIAQELKLSGPFGIRNFAARKVGATPKLIEGASPDSYEGFFVIPGSSRTVYTVFFHYNPTESKLNFLVDSKTSLHGGGEQINHLYPELGLPLLPRQALDAGHKMASLPVRHSIESFKSAADTIEAYTSLALRGHWFLGSFSAFREGISPDDKPELPLRLFVDRIDLGRYGSKNREQYLHADALDQRVHAIKSFIDTAIKQDEGIYV
jgi:hypothetical protein